MSDELRDFARMAADEHERDADPFPWSRQTQRLNLNGNYADFAASRARDRREWEADEFGIDED